MPDDIGIGILAVLTESQSVSTIVVFAEGRSEFSDGDWIFVDKTAAERVIAAFDKQGVQVPIDYEHSTVYKGDEKQEPAPAAGWIKSMRWVAGKGLVADVEWSEEADGYIKGKAYKYLSPVFTYDRETHAPKRLHSVALTNRPATREQKELLAAASARFFGEPDMADSKTKPKKDDTGATKVAQDEGVGDGGNPIMKLAVALTKAGVEVEGGNDDAVINAAIQFITSQAGGDGEGEAPPAESEAAAKDLLAVLGAKSGEEAIVKLKADFVPRTEVKAMTDRIAELENRDRTREIDAEFERLIAANKINPNDDAQVKACRTLAKNDFEGFKAFMEAQQPVIAAGRIVKSSSQDIPKSREAIIAKADAEWQSQGRDTGCGRAAWINGALREAEMSTMSAKELQDHN